AERRRPGRAAGWNGGHGPAPLLLKLHGRAGARDARAPARPVGGSLVRADGETLGVAVADGGLLPVVQRFEERNRRDVGLADGVAEQGVGVCLVGQVLPALTDVARGLGEDLVDLLTAEVLVLGLEELLGLQVRDGGGEGTLVEPGLNTLTRVGVLDEGVTKSRVLGVGRDRKGAAAVLRADHLALLPLRERGH